MFESIRLTNHINRFIEHVNNINESQWVKINELEKRIEMLEKNQTSDIVV